MFEEVDAVIETGLDLERYIEGPPYSIEVLAWAVAYIRSKLRIKKQSENGGARNMASNEKK